MKKTKLHASLPEIKKFISIDLDAAIYFDVERQVRIGVGRISWAIGEQIHEDSRLYDPD